jgi:hypothetical protein
MIDQIVFSEPSGWPLALVQFSAALVFLGLYVYFGIIKNSTSSSWVLFFVVGNSLAGIAESLPKARRQTAGVLRLSAVLVLTSFLATTFFAPELVTG